MELDLPPSCKIRKIVDGKQEINLEWPYHKTRSQDDALDTAVNEDRLEDVKLLIQNGANPMMNCQYDNTSVVEASHSTLERAILKRNKPMVMAMLNKRGPKEGCEETKAGAWEIDIEKLKDVKGCIIGSNISHRHTPFAKLIDNLPDVAAMALDHCITTNGAPHEKDYLIRFDCSLLENETSNTNKCYRGFPCARVYDIVRHRETMKEDTKCFVEKTDEQNYDAYEKHQHPLYKVMLSNDPGLLKHPVVQALLEKKLKLFGWWLYYSNLLFYILLVFLLTDFILILPNPQDRKCAQYKNLDRNVSLSEAEDFNYTSGSECSIVGLDSELPALLALKVDVLILAIIRLILELYQLYSNKLVGYFNDWVNWFELTEYIIIIVFLLSVETSECFCPQTWEWELGVVSLALSWMILIVWLQAMPWIGIYVTILLKIIVSFGRVAIFGVLLVVGFGLTFYLLFYQQPQNESVNMPSTFSSPLRAILSVISLTAGEFETSDVFYSDSADSPSPGRQYESLALIIWFAGVIIMSVLFNNLLVGLAVGEVSSVKDEARITTIKQRIELVLTQEEQFPEFIHTRFIQTKPIVVHPNKRSLILHFLLGCPVLTFGLCSIFCCNHNHERYWGTIFDSLGVRQSKKYTEVPELIEKTQTDVERGEGSPVTKQDIQNLNEQMKKKLTEMQDMLLLEIKKGMNKSLIAPETLR